MWCWSLFSLLATCFGALPAQGQVQGGTWAPAVQLLGFCAQGTCLNYIPAFALNCLQLFRFYWNYISSFTESCRRPGRKPLDGGVKEMLRIFPQLSCYIWNGTFRSDFRQELPCSRVLLRSVNVKLVIFPQHPTVGKQHSWAERPCPHLSSSDSQPAFPNRVPPGTGVQFGELSPTPTPFPPSPSLAAVWLLPSVCGLASLSTSLHILAILTYLPSSKSFSPPPAFSEVLSHPLVTVWFSWNF